MPPVLYDGSSPHVQRAPSPTDRRWELGAAGAAAAVSSPPYHAAAR